MRWNQVMLGEKRENAGLRQQIGRPWSSCLTTEGSEKFIFWVINSTCKFQLCSSQEKVSIEPQFLVMLTSPLANWWLLILYLSLSAIEGRYNVRSVNWSKFQLVFHNTESTLFLLLTLRSSWSSLALKEYGWVIVLQDQKRC